MEALKPPKYLNINENVDNNWRLWQKQFKYYAIATGLDTKEENIKVATFMTCIGPEATKLADTLEISEEATLKEVTQKFTETFTPKTNYTYERFLFNNLKQEQGERFDEFLTKIKLQLIKCNFDNIKPDDILKDKIIIGIIKNDLRQKFLSNDTQSIDEVIRICKTNEITLQQLESFKNEQVYAVHNIINKNETKNYLFLCAIDAKPHMAPEAVQHLGKCVNCAKRKLIYP